MTNILINFISKERLEPYLVFSKGDMENALKLYEYNIRFNKSFYLPLHNTEISLRNSFHNAIAKKYGIMWYDNENLLLGSNMKDIISLNRIEEAKNRVKKINPQVNDIISNLSFSFWSALLHPNHEVDIWRPCLRNIFSSEKKITRSDIHKRVEFLKYFRNRIAHHECNLKYDLKIVNKTIYELLDMISLEMSKWTRQQDDFADLYEEYVKFKGNR